MGYNKNLERSSWPEIVTKIEFLKLFLGLFLLPPAALAPSHPVLLNSTPPSHHQCRVSFSCPPLERLFFSLGESKHLRSPPSLLSSSPPLPVPVPVGTSLNSMSSRKMSRVWAGASQICSSGINQTVGIPATEYTIENLSRLY